MGHNNDKRELTGARDFLGRLIYSGDLIVSASEGGQVCINRVLGRSRWHWGWIAIDEAWEGNPCIGMIIRASSCVVVSPDLTNYERYMADLGTMEQVSRAITKICVYDNPECNDDCPICVICDMTENGADGWMYETDWQTLDDDFEDFRFEVWQKYAKRQQPKSSESYREYARSNLKKYMNRAYRNQRRSNSFVEGEYMMPEPSFDLQKSFISSADDVPFHWEGTD